MVGTNWMDILLTVGSAGALIVLGYVVLRVASTNSRRY
jgi:hypothetical protein